MGTCLAGQQLSRIVGAQRGTEVEQERKLLPSGHLTPTWESPMPPPSKCHQPSVEHPVLAAASGEASSPSNDLCSLRELPRGRRSSCGGSWSTEPIPEEPPAAGERCQDTVPPAQHSSAPVQDRPGAFPALPTGNWDAGSAPSCPPAAPESRCSWLRQPSHQRQPLHGGAGGRELFFQRPAGRAGLPAREIPTAGKGRGKDSSIGTARPICRASLPARRHDLQDGGTEVNGSCPTLPQLRRRT